jgi:hypothetical protein
VPALPADHRSPDGVDSPAAGAPWWTTRRRRAALIAAGALVAFAVASQLILPTIAARRVRSGLERSGQVTSVDVSAFPAVKLLLGRADRINIRMTSYRAAIQGGGSGSAPAVGDTLARLRGIGALDVTIGSLGIAVLVLREVHLSKRGADLNARAMLTTSAVRDVLPAGFSLPSSPIDEGLLTIDGPLRTVGLPLRRGARVIAEDGRLVLRPEGPSLGSLASLALFDDPRVAVTDVRVDRASGGFLVHLEGRV